VPRATAGPLDRVAVAFPQQMVVHVVARHRPDIPLKPDRQRRLPDAPRRTPLATEIADVVMLVEGNDVHTRSARIGAICGNQIDQVRRHHVELLKPESGHRPELDGKVTQTIGQLERAAQIDHVPVVPAQE